MTEEKAAQYPRILQVQSTKAMKKNKGEPSKYSLLKHFINHRDKFDAEYKRQMFEFGEIQLQEETMKKYDRVSGQAQINFLALNKKS